MKTIWWLSELPWSYYIYRCSGCTLYWKKIPTRNILFFSRISLKIAINSWAKYIKVKHFPQETKTNTSKTHIETHRHMSCTHHLYTLVVQILTPPLQQWLTNYGFSIFYLEIVLCLLFNVWMTLLSKRDTNSHPPWWAQTNLLVFIYLCWKW